MAIWEHVGEVKQCRCGGAQLWVAPAHGGPVHCGEAGCELDEKAALFKLGCTALGRAMGEAIWSELRRPSLTSVEEILLKR